MRISRQSVVEDPEERRWLLKTLQDKVMDTTTSNRVKTTLKHNFNLL